MATEQDQVQDSGSDSLDQTAVTQDQQDEGAVVVETTNPAQTDSAVDVEMSDDAQPNDTTWQPTEEELAASIAFDQANAENQSGERQLTEAQLMQEMLDHEMALQFDAMENGAGHTINLPWNDQGVPPETFECVCGDTFTHADLREERAIMITCEHQHVRCKDCLNENVRVGMSSKKNYPPKCCGPFDIVDIIDYLEEDVRDLYFQRFEEYSDVAPVYCAVKECSQYLTKEKLVEEGRWAVCNVCDIRTCTGCLCLESAHDQSSAECPERIDKMDKELMAREGWKKCPRCNNMIEKDDGCDHMTCECGQNFCYTCGRPLGGAIACNCNGQRAWVDEDEDAHDTQAQQQILDDILRANNGLPPREDDEDDSGDEDDIEEVVDEIEGEEEEDVDSEEPARDPRGVTRPVLWPRRHRVGEAEEDLARLDVPEVVEDPITEQDTEDLQTEPATDQPSQAPTEHEQILHAIRALYRTDPELATRMDIMSRSQVRPYTLPGFAADTRRVKEMSGEEFNEAMNSLGAARRARGMRVDVW